ncbi:MAG TPA: transglycosylase SLT domain-containing protein [Candidatus Dormibacteraeota bacterium]|nr:transglycosylase SLT domain-containing protein [Candidatus Dormibacteraeota bacterium]
MQMLRPATLLAAAVVAVAAIALAPQQHRPAPLAIHAVANIGMFAMLPTGGAAVPNEPAGRVMRWENDKLVSAEAEAAAAAKAAADAAARQAAMDKARAATPARSAPTQTATPGPIPSYAPGTVQDIITKAFTPYGSTAVAWGLRVAKCESGYNPTAYNPAGPYYGLFQFLMSTFKATPYGGQDIYDPVANASAAAWKYSQGGAGAWGCK